MNPIAWVRWPSRRGSWHVFLTYLPEGTIRTRCGRTIADPATVIDGVPANERTCETCAVLTLHDQEPVDVSNDPVPE